VLAVRDEAALARSSRAARSRRRVPCGRLAAGVSSAA
jgi:hypothetical protein